MNTIIIREESEEKWEALKAVMKVLKINFELISSKSEKPYSSEFIEKIEKSRQDYKEGKFTSVKKEDLQNFLGL